MPRPKLSDADKHIRSFRVRLRPDDANLLLALAKKADVPPAILLRSLIRKQLPLVRVLRGDIRIESAEPA